MNYEYFGHTADVGFRAYGKNLTQLFINSGKALFGVMTNLSKVGTETETKIEIEGDNVEDLLYNWLNELIYLFETLNCFFKDFQIEIKRRKGKYFLKGVIRGEKVNLKKHEIGNEVKAITYHNFKVEKTGQKYVANVLLDI